MRELNAIEMNIVSGGGLVIGGGLSNNTGGANGVDVVIGLGVSGSAGKGGKGGKGVGVVINGDSWWKRSK